MFERIDVANTWVKIILPVNAWRSLSASCWK